MRERGRIRACTCPAVPSAAAAAVVVAAAPAAPAGGSAVAVAANNLECSLSDLLQVIHSPSLREEGQPTSESPLQLPLLLLPLLLLLQLQQLLQ